MDIEYTWILWQGKNCCQFRLLNGTHLLVSSLSSHYYNLDNTITEKENEKDESNIDKHDLINQSIDEAINKMDQQGTDNSTEEKGNFIYLIPR